MSYAVNWVTGLITIPRADLTLISGNQYRLNTADFHKEIRRLEWLFDEGIWALQVIKYTEPETLGGTPFAPRIKVINNYTIAFEEFAGVYSVEIDGANTNIADVTIVNNVSIRTKNTGGLVGMTEITEIYGRVGLDKNAPLVTNSVSVSFGGVSMTIFEDANGEVTVTRQ